MGEACRKSNLWKIMISILAYSYVNCFFLNTFYFNFQERQRLSSWHSAKERWAWGGGRWGPGISTSRKWLILVLQSGFAAVWAPFCFPLLLCLSSTSCSEGKRASQGGSHTPPVASVSRSTLSLWAICHLALHLRWKKWAFLVNFPIFSTLTFFLAITIRQSWGLHSGI